MNRTSPTWTNLLVNVGGFFITSQVEVAINCQLNESLPWRFATIRSTGSSQSHGVKVLSSSTQLRLLTVAEYHLMVEAGILATDERVELIEGQLFEIATKGTAHSAAVTRIDRVLSRRLEGLALIRWQDPVQLSDRSEPEPDVAIVAFDPLDYEEHHPTVVEIFWLIEVADTTLRRDLELKTPLTLITELDTESLRVAL